MVFATLGFLGGIGPKIGPGLAYAFGGSAGSISATSSTIQLAAIAASGASVIHAALNILNLIKNLTINMSINSGEQEKVVVMEIAVVQEMILVMSEIHTHPLANVVK